MPEPVLTAIEYCAPSPPPAGVTLAMLAPVTPVGDEDEAVGITPVTGAEKINR